MEQAAHREVDAALAVGREVVDDAAQAVQRIAVRQLVGENPSLRRQLRHVLPQAALHHERVALLAHRERAAGVRIRIDRRHFAARIELHDGAVVILRDEQIAVLVGKDAVGVVAADVPCLGPLLAGGNHAGNLRHRVVRRRRRESRGCRGGCRCQRVRQPPRPRAHRRDARHRPQVRPHVPAAASCTWRSVPDSRDPAPPAGWHRAAARSGRTQRRSRARVEGTGRSFVSCRHFLLQSGARRSGTQACPADWSAGRAPKS